MYILSPIHLIVNIYKFIFVIGNLNDQLYNNRK